MPSLRITGGVFCGQKVGFAALKDVRPSLGRVREVLFNWLGQDLSGYRCLDLFSGSGILSFEALSRGAVQSTLVDQNRTCLRFAHQAAAHLNVNQRVCLVCRSAERFLVQLKTIDVDIVFMDPPFYAGKIERLLHEIARVVPAKALLYVERGCRDQQVSWQGWQSLREKVLGEVAMCLLERAETL